MTRRIASPQSRRSHAWHIASLAQPDASKLSSRLQERRRLRRRLPPYLLPSAGGAADVEQEISEASEVRHRCTAVDEAMLDLPAGERRTCSHRLVHRVSRRPGGAARTSFTINQGPPVFCPEAALRCGMADSPEQPLRVTRMTAHQRPDSSDVVRIEAELSPLPPEEEQWWWLEQVHRQIGWAGVGLSTSSSRFAIHGLEPAYELEAAARQLRDALAPQLLSTRSVTTIESGSDGRGSEQSGQRRSEDSTMSRPSGPRPE